MITSTLLQSQGYDSSARDSGLTAVVQTLNTTVEMRPTEEYGGNQIQLNFT